MERTELAAIEALRSMFALVPTDVAEELGMGTLELGDAFAVRVRFLSGSSELNHALGISAAAQLDALPAFYGDTQHSVSPLPGVDLDAELRERGYEPGYAWMKFRRGVASPSAPSTDLDIVEVDADRGADFGRAAVEGYGMPRRFADWLSRLPAHDGWHCFVAYDGSEPAASGALHVFEDVGWLGSARRAPSSVAAAPRAPSSGPASAAQPSSAARRS